MGDLMLKKDVGNRQGCKPASDFLKTYLMYY
jgi:hypothetical protein